jgi:hypothetical protein
MGATGKSESRACLLIFSEVIICLLLCKAEMPLRNHHAKGQLI